MSNQRKDPFANHRFRIEISGVVQANFCEAAIPDSISEVIEHREGTSVNVQKQSGCDSASALGRMHDNEGTSVNVQKQSGLVTYGNLVLKWGLTSSMELYNWRKMIEQGKVSSVRKNIAVILIDEEGNDAAKWEFTNAWPRV